MIEEVIMINNFRWGMAVVVAGLITASSGETVAGLLGKLQLEGELVVARSQSVVEMTLTSTEAPKNGGRPNTFFVKTALTNQPIVVPAGEYTICSASISQSEKTGTSIGFRMDKKFVVSPEQVTKLILDLPEAVLAVNQKGRQLAVQRQIISSSTPGITYLLALDQEPLVVDAVDSSDPSKVLIGRKPLDYG
jgi:hypothetical protein